MWSLDNLGWEGSSPKISNFLNFLTQAYLKHLGTVTIKLWGTTAMNVHIQQISIVPCLSFAIFSSFIFHTLCPPYKGSHTPLERAISYQKGPFSTTFLLSWSGTISSLRVSNAQCFNVLSIRASWARNWSLQWILPGVPGSRTGMYRALPQASFHWCFPTQHGSG